MTGLDERGMRAGIKPGKTAAHDLHIESVPAVEIGAVDVGDFQFATTRGLDGRGDVDDFVVVEI